MIKPNAPSQVKRTSAHRRRHVAVLELGTCKVACIIAETPLAGETDERAIITGFGYHRGEGLRGGHVTHMVEAERAIRAAVDGAERMAETAVSDLIVSISPDRLMSRIATVEISLNQQIVTDEHVVMAMRHATEQLYHTDYDILHAIPIDYAVDESRRLHDPRGLIGQVLRVDVHVISVPIAPLQNIRACLERCHLDVQKFILSPYASALATLTADEMDLGVLHLEMGGSTTGYSVFFEGHPVLCGVVPAGAHHITRDLAHGLGVPLATAERIKNLVGSALSTTHGADEIDVASDGDEPVMVQYDALTKIIRPRLEETFELVKQNLSKSDLAQLAGRRMVLSGGGASLNGAREFAQHYFDRTVRVATPMRLNGLPDMAAHTAFSGAAGAVAYARKADQTALPAMPLLSRWSNIGQWLKLNF